MPLDAIFDTNALVHVVRNLKVPSQFLLDTFFPNAVEYDTEYVSIDVDVGLRRMAPFCAPIVEGKPVEGRKWQTNTFRPAYLKDLRTPDFRRPVLRAIGERIGGALSPEERVQLNLAFEMEDQVQMVDRRLEWMAAQALIDGKYTVAGDGFETTQIDFGRDAALTIDISSTGTNNPWVLDGELPSQNLDIWAQLVLQKSGAAPTDVVFTPGAWALFVSDTRVQKSVWYLRSGDSRIEFGGGMARGAMYKGDWGNYRLWLYNDWYINASGAEQPMIPNNYVLMSSPQMEGVRAFGVIMDEDFNYGPLAYAPKTWVEKNPSRRHLLMQSAPLVIPSRVNACLRAKVA